MAAVVPSRRYEVLERIAVGGMAEIFLARVHGPEGFEKLVVLKRPLPQLAADREFTRMFLDEARLAATLDHPNIAHVYDFGFAEDRWFYAMEYVHGEDLRGVLNRAHRVLGGLPLHVALAIEAGILQGLHYAHERRGPDGAPLGLVHRDVSPSNVLVSYDGSVKVVDFGIAKAQNLPSTPAGGGGLKGKLAYMAPEQLLGQEIDRRVDVFAAGILLYEMTTGARLFRGSPDETIGRILTAPILAPRSILASYPEGLERIVLRALERDRAARYATAQDMQIDLEQWALRERRTMSAIALQRFMSELFGTEIAAWQRAAETPESLAEHATQTLSERSRTAPGPLTVPEPSAGAVALAGQVLAAEAAAPTPSVPPAVARSEARSHATRPWWIVAVLAAIAAAVIGGVATSGGDPSPSPPPAAATAPAAAARTAATPAAAPASKEPSAEPDAPPVASPEPVGAGPSSPTDRARRGAPGKRPRAPRGRPGGTTGADSALPW